MRRISPILPPPILPPPKLLALALLAWAVSPMPDAAAQLRPGGMSAPAPAGEAPSRPPPAALPGLQYRRAPEPIPPAPGQNLGPNAALFDAINRGDLAAAREAVGRGADIESRNVLGLTPVDAAVDQGRAEIMFYLLSVRGSTRSAPPPEAPAAPPPAARTAARRAGPADAPAAERMLPNPTRQAPNPRLWAGDGGAPIPSLGFLGFDAGRPDGAVPPAAETRANPARPARAGRG